MMKTLINSNLSVIAKNTSTPAAEVVAYYNKVMRFLDQHTSCDSDEAARVALNETFLHFRKNARKTVALHEPRTYISFP